MDSRRRAIMGISKGRLPSGYQEVEWLGWGSYTEGYKYFTLSNTYKIDYYKELLYDIDFNGSDASMLIANGRAWGSGFTYKLRRRDTLLNEGNFSISQSIIYYGCFYTSVPASYSNAIVKMKELIFYKNNAIVNDFIPCYRKADNKPGLYDIVNDVFYTNANTSASTDFIVGPDV